MCAPAWNPVAHETPLTHRLTHAARGIAAPRALARVFALSGLLLAAACGNDGGPSTDARALAQTIAEPRRPAYRVVDVGRGGMIRGMVRLDGDAPRDSAVRATTDQQVCGESVSERVIVGARGRLGEAIVWLDEVTAGKPLPLMRRFGVTSERCRLEPRVQAALTGGTLNVKSDDPIPHVTRFLLAGADTTLALVRQSGAGQVVPTEAPLARPARVQVRCDRHPWTTAWIQVFDHPYFAVTRRDGGFVLDSVPPGLYRLVVWHERLGSQEQRVTVEAGQEARVELVF